MTDQTTDVLAEAKPWLAQCASCDAGLPMSCSHPAGDYRPVMARLVAEIDRLRVLASAARPRPVPSPEDRMADARTDTPHTFRTYLDATERDQLDARAATAEAERDEATEDRDLLRAENANLAAGLRTERVKTGRLEGDLRSQTQAVRELRRQLDDMTATAAGFATERDEARRELERWTSGKRIRGLEPPKDVPDGLTYAARLARAQGTEGGPEHDDLLAGAAQRLRTLNDVARRQQAIITALAEQAAASSVPSRRAQEPTAGEARRLLDQAIDTALPLAGRSVRKLLKALRRELARVDAGRAPAEARP